MSKHLLLGLVSIVIAGLLAVVLMGHDTAEAPMLAEENVSTSTQQDGMGVEASSSIDAIEEIVAPEPTDITPVPVLPPAEVPPVSAGCMVSGCSSQLCVEAGNDMATTCEWREQYACYQTATCERQASGQCGWTDTAELRQCIATADSGSSLTQ